LARDWNKINTIVSIIILFIAIPPFVSFCYNLLRPIRAELTISVDSISFSFTDSTTASMSVPVRVINYSPKEAHIKDWSLVLNFDGTSFQFPNHNCTHGLTDLLSAQQTEFDFSYDISNHTSFVNSLASGVFTISFIDDLGTQQQHFEFFTGHWLSIQSSGVIGG